MLCVLQSIKNKKKEAVVKRKKLHKEFNIYKKNSVVIKRLRVGKNKKHSPLSTFGRIFSLKVCSYGSVADAKFAAVVKVNHLNCSYPYPMLPLLVLSTSPPCTHCIVWRKVFNEELGAGGKRLGLCPQARWQVGRDKIYNYVGKYPLQHTTLSLVADATQTIVCAGP
jgi:hypothetical protein